MSSCTNSPTIQTSHLPTGASSTSTPSFYQSISYQDQLKSTIQDKLAYLNNIFGNQSDLVQKFEWENHQLKLLVSVLLHFKHMFLYVTKDVNFHNLTTVTEDLMVNNHHHHLHNKTNSITSKKSSLSYDEAMLLKTDLDHCLTKFSTIIKSSNCFDFVHEKETHYYRFNSRYQPYREDINGCANENNNNNILTRQLSTVQRKTNQRIINSGSSNNNCDIRSSISSSSSSIEVFEPIQTSNNVNNSTHNRQNSSSSYSSQNIEINSSENSTVDLISSIPTFQQQQQHQQFIAEPKQNNVALSNHNRSNNDEMDSQQEEYEMSLQVDDGQYDSGNSFQDGQSFTVNSDQMEVNLTEDDMYFSCSYSECTFKSKSWTQVQAHEFRRHKSIKEEVLEPDDPDPTPIMTESSSPYSVTTCTICRKQFKTCEMYMAHIDKWHIQGEFKCQSPGCDYVAPYRIELTRHSKREHYNIIRRKNHPCTWPDCGKSFTSITLLKNHLRVHLKYKRFRCKWPDCTYASEQDSNVIRHIRIRHFKLPITVKEQIELNISHDQNPHDFMEVMPEDVVV